MDQNNFEFLYQFALDSLTERGRICAKTSLDTVSENLERMRLLNENKQYLKHIHLKETFLKNCRICGNICNIEMYGEANPELCWSCERAEQFCERKDLIIHNGRIFSDGGWRDSKPEWGGHGGLIFKYRFLDKDEVFTTNNLWYEMTVPLEFLKRLKDNAEFIKEKS